MIPGTIHIIIIIIIIIVVAVVVVVATAPCRTRYVSDGVCLSAEAVKGRWQQHVVQSRV